MNFTPHGRTPGFPIKLQDTPVARRSCAAANVSDMQAKLVSLRDLRKGLRASMQEFETSTKWEDTVNAGLMATRWVKATCDAFLSMTASAVGALDPTGKLSAAGKVNAGYKVLATVADAGARAHAGQNVDKGVLFRELKDGAAGVAKEFIPGKTGQRVTEMANVYTNIMADAVNNDQERLKREVFGSQTSMLLNMVGDYAKQENFGGTAKTSRAMAAMTEIMTAAHAFERELEKAGDAYLDESMDIERRRDMIRRTMSSQLAQLDVKIDRLLNEIDSCFVPR